MSSDISPIYEDEAIDRVSTPDGAGISKGSLAKQKRSPGLIGSPTPERAGQDKALHQEDRTHHANAMTLYDLFSGQERPNSAPLERPLSQGGMVSPTLPPPGSSNKASAGSQAQQPQQQLALSPEQATFHPQPRRHQPFVTSVLESEASPTPQSPEREKVLRPLASSVRAKGGVSSAPPAAHMPPTGSAVAAAGAGGAGAAELGASASSRTGPGGGGGASGSGGAARAGSVEPFASTPSPDRDAGSAHVQDWASDSPKPGISHRSVQNTPEPTHYHYGAGMGGFGPGGQPISTPSPSAMSALMGHGNSFLGMPPRFPHPSASGVAGMGDMMMSMLPPPLPTPTGTGTSAAMGMGFGSAFRPSVQEAAAAAAAAAVASGNAGSEQMSEAAAAAVDAKSHLQLLPPGVPPAGGPPMQPGLPLGFQDAMAQQLAVSYQAFQQQAFNFGALAAAAAASWRVHPPCPCTMGNLPSYGAETAALSALPSLSGWEYEQHQHQAIQADGQRHQHGFGGAGLLAGELMGGHCASTSSRTVPPPPAPGAGAEERPQRPGPRSGKGSLEVSAAALAAAGCSAAVVNAAAAADASIDDGPDNGLIAGKWDPLTLPPEAAELLGNVSSMSKSQAGSKFLQRQLQKGTGPVVDVILDGVEQEIGWLMCDAYGNYLCSVAFQACSQRQRKRMLQKLAPEVASIACDKRGTHALQALIGLLQNEEEQHQLMSAIRAHVIELCMDPNGTHVVQRLLFCFVPPVTDWIYAAVNDRLIEVAHHPYGLCVLKKCISQAKQPGKHRSMLLQQLTNHALDLVQSPYGNYAIQHALEEWGGEVCTSIFEKLEGRMMQLSIQKFSSNVVEKLFCLAPPDFRNRFISELVESEKMSVLVNSNYGHYVAKRALQMATPEQSRALVEAIRANLSSLPNRRLRAKWEKVMNGGGDDDEDDRNLDNMGLPLHAFPGKAPGRGGGKGSTGTGKGRNGKARGGGQQFLEQ
eukprot:TRINITY_DN24496_c0_g1_i1.p1 TRINITY_DN24496_c0_g1~~TRINITY_DN24496_c0_g1_i1.p1  ORF type:complete len:979 (+),score=209.52 TRINITY_DN24496_c0_g1_i1:114-3050(+)